MPPNGHCIYSTILTALSSCYTQILMVLGNVAHKEKEFCDQLAQFGLLPALSATLKMADQEVVILSLEVLFILVAGNPLVSKAT